MTFESYISSVGGSVRMSWLFTPREAGFRILHVLSLFALGFLYSFLPQHKTHAYLGRLETQNCPLV